MAAVAALTPDFQASNEHMSTPPMISTQQAVARRVVQKAGSCLPLLHLLKCWSPVPAVGTTPLNRPVMPWFRKIIFSRDCMRMVPQLSTHGGF